MAGNIGKYHILERIGRGGMGTIFKAHDPVLDRMVAVKVISNDIEVTAELRARFFREAQACARLSHPNIVTVHDMGEDDGRLFIVMELLEGQELRHLIAEGASPLPLEDKLSIMSQVCDGLHYAHQRGIIHRDIKPGNIMLLPRGQVKILDFGVARIATSERDLTRTGLIMGTLRYIAPEQMQGRVDHRSDIFSAGAVFYELVNGRPPFAGTNPVQILEQIRIHDPASLADLNPGVPTELAALVDRAMRKDPDERFQDLAQMRARIEDVQRQLEEERRQIWARLFGQRADLVRLQQELADRVGGPAEALAEPIPDERARTAVLLSLERDLVVRVDALRAEVARANALAPALRAASELLRAGSATEAVVHFERIIAAMPQHVAARGMLAEARIEVEAERRRRLAAGRLQEARAALDDGAYALCFALLEQAAEVSGPDLAAMIASVRGTAEAARAGHESARQHTEQARDRMMEARRSAQAWAAPHHAPAIWSDGEAQHTEGQSAFERAAYEEAARAFDRGTLFYRQAEESVHEAVRALEITRPAMEPLVPVPPIKDVWPASVSDQRTGDGPLAIDAAVSLDATTLLERAQEHAAARPPASREVGPASADGSGKETVTSSQSPHGVSRPGTRRRRALVASGTVVALAGAAAIVLGVVTWPPRMPQPTVPSEPAAARGTTTGPAPVVPSPEPSSPDQSTADSRKMIAPVPAEQKDAAARAGHGEKADKDAPTNVPDRRGLDEAQQVRSGAIGARGEAEKSAAPRLAAQAFSSARQQEAEGEAALRRQDAANATLRFREAQRGYREAAQRAERAAAADQERITMVQRQQAEAERTREVTAGARRAAERAAAGRYAQKLLASAQVKEREAEGALGRSDYATASRLFGEARSDYQGAAQEAERQDIAIRSTTDQSRRAALAIRETALKIEADRLVKVVFDAAQAKQVEAETLVNRQDHAAATQAYIEAGERYAEASRRAKLIQESRAVADQTRGRMLVEKQRARQDAREFNDALSQERQGAEQYQRAAFKEATESFAAAADLFTKASTRPVERAPERPGVAEEVRRVLGTYARAFETKDIKLVQKIRPGLKPDEASRLQSSFDQSKEYRLTLRIDSIDVSGDEAVVKGRREDSVISKSGQSLRNGSNFAFRLKRTGDGWIIDAVMN